MAEIVLKPWQDGDEDPAQGTIVWDRHTEAHVYEEWRDWLIAHGCEPFPILPQRRMQMDRRLDTFCWIMDRDVALAYRLRWT